MGGRNGWRNVVAHYAPDGLEIPHTVAAPSGSILAAGTAKISAEGRVIKTTGWSGHFRTDETFSIETANAIFHFAGLR